MISERLTRIEERILGGPTWATQGMNFQQRLRFYRDTGQWPGLHTKGVTQMVMQNDIDAEKEQGKDFCAQQKLERAKEAGLDIK